MPRSLFKIEFPDRVKGVIKLPAGAQILKTGLQNKGEGYFIALWFLAPSSKGIDEMSAIEVKTTNVPTGSTVPDGFKYVGSIHENPGTPEEIVQHQFVDASAPISFA